MDASDLSLVHAYALKVEDNITNGTFERFRFAFPDASIPTLKETESRIKFLSGFQGVAYDCCPNSCICYTGPYESVLICPTCHTSRLHQGRPQARFYYLPLIPRLRAMYANRKRASKMRYRHERDHDPTKIADIFDGAYYRSLLTKFIKIGDQELPTWFFSDPRDIALGLSTDGFGPFKHRNKTTWPIIIFNYNLPPEERFLKHNIISIGTIPGPNKPCDPDSFLWPLIQELIQLEAGVTAFDAISQALFILRAFLIIIFGDIPAISMLMHVKGHNGFSPCRMCEITGVRTPGDRATTHYVPLSRVGFSQNSYDPLNLPLRTHEDFIRKARKVQMAPNNAQHERLAKKYGIKGIPLLSALSSLSFPISFPYDFMHLIWANLLPNLILLWTGKFKALDHDDEDYVIEHTVWESIGAATVAAGKTMPAAFGARVPDLSSEKAYMTCETYSIWTLFLAPVLLKGRFKKSYHYKHFVELVRLLTLCLEYEISQDEINDLEKGFKEWVEKYERWVVLLFYG